MVEVLSISMVIWAKLDFLLLCLDDKVWGEYYTTEFDDSNQTLQSKVPAPNTCLNGCDIGLD